MISIIIPVYNGEKTIAKTLKSLLVQSYKNFEVIVISDGSTDGTEKIVTEHMSLFQDSGIRFMFVNRKDNKGVQKTRNEGFAYSNGTYLLFCDADVVFISSALRDFIDAFEKNSQAVFAYSSHRFGRKLFRFFPFDLNKLKSMPYIHSTSMIRREAYPKEGWDESLKKFHDWDLFLTICKKGGSGVWIDKVLFTIAPGGTMSAWLPSFVYKFMPFLPQVKKYQQAERIIKQKHGII